MEGVMRKLSVLIIAAVLVSGCSHVKGSFRNVDGKAYDLDKMEQVQTGMTIGQVTALVGEPYSITELGSTMVHRYFMVREKIDKDKALGVISVEQKTTETYEVIIDYENNILVRKQLTRAVEKPEEKGKK
jgi:outer membrane protein assembly factor BamE (lipoprotein component of BamABCDE complex)